MFNVSSYLLAVLMIVFGLNKFLGFIPVQPPTDLIAQQFMGTMFSSYLFKLVALTEILGGILLLMSKTRFIAFLLLAPVLFNIIAFHVAHDFIGNGIWLLPTLLFILIGYYQRSKLNLLLNTTTHGK